MSTPSRNTVIHIAAACDEAYVMPLAVMLRSLADNLGDNFSVVAYIIHETLPAAAMSRLQASIPGDGMEIRWLPLDEAGAVPIPAAIRSYDHISPASYFRLLLPDLLPAELDRVIYLDCDLVVQADIGLLWQIDIGDHYAAAVPELTEDSHLVSSVQGIRHWRDLGLPEHLAQFNAGVLLINLAQWRAKAIGARAFTYLEAAADQVRWHDQEALNVVFAGNWLPLDACWNLTMRHLVSDRSQAIGASCIIHYHTAEKPWHADYPFAMREVFLEYLDRTAWAGWRPSSPFLARIRRLSKRVVKALRKRQHAWRQWREEQSRRSQGMCLLASRLVHAGTPVPQKCTAGEVRVFMVSAECTALARALIDYYLGRGADRVLVIIEERQLAEWQTVFGSHTRVHPVMKGKRSDDDAVRALLHQHGQGHWCLLTRADEWFRFPGDDQLTLAGLARLLDTQHYTALVSRKLQSCDANTASDEVLGDTVQCGAFHLPVEQVCKLPMAMRDSIHNRVFIAEGYVLAGKGYGATDILWRSAVPFLKYRADILIAPGAGGAGRVQIAAIEGLLLQLPALAQTDAGGQVEALLRTDWRLFESAGLLHSASMPASVASS